MADRAQTLATIYEALGRADIDAIRPHVREDVEVVERLEVPGANSYRGIDEWQRGYEREAETLSSFAIDLMGVEPVGERCVVDVVVKMRGKESGAAVGERMAHLVDFDGDRVARWRAFSELDEARSVARMDEIAELYELWAQGEIESAMARVHPEIEWAEPEETIGAQSGTGTEWAREGIEQWADSFDTYGGSVTGIESVGESVLVEWTQRVRAGGSSVELETPVQHLWSFTGGLPSRMRMYFGRDQALEEAAKS